MWLTLAASLLPCVPGAWTAAAAAAGGSQEAGPAERATGQSSATPKRPRGTEVGKDDQASGTGCQGPLFPVIVGQVTLGLGASVCTLAAATLVLQKIKSNARFEQLSSPESRWTLAEITQKSIVDSKTGAPLTGDTNVSRATYLVDFFFVAQRNDGSLCMVKVHKRSTSHKTWERLKDGDKESVTYMLGDPRLNCLMHELDSAANFAAHFASAMLAVLFVYANLFILTMEGNWLRTLIWLIAGGGGSSYLVYKRGEFWDSTALQNPFLQSGVGSVRLIESDIIEGADLPMEEGQVASAREQTGTEESHDGQ
eukprot:CAMPEP_0179058514 /NCGR_PEP_ID=MMETSP0796-20121207/24886_1 /TAXON_ID=73915 /ORGANISM="Pyrodinium bahamense, Strain pbaha01" /LENGTH=310 /DNA_ID=CAMNT_0020755261 /DNA_START=41 /DNA_END=973 /DNA_ORIENTATION=+